jgi:hypothetical protein
MFSPALTIFLILDFVRLGFGNVRLHVADLLINEGQEALDPPAGQLVQGNVRSPIGQAGLGVQTRYAQSEQASGQTRSILSMVVWRRSAHPLDPDLESGLVPVRAAVKGQQPAVP